MTCGTACPSFVWFAIIAVLLFGLACTTGSAAEENAKKKPDLSRLAERLDKGWPVTVVFFGDSISEVGRHERWHGGASKAETNWGNVLADRLREAYPRTEWTVKFFGIGGQNAYEALGRSDWLWDLSPHLVLVAFGANDCAHHELRPDQTERALTELVGKIRPRADVVVCGTAGNAPGVERFKHVEETADAAKAAAEAHGAPFVDLRAAVLKATDGGETWKDLHLNATNCHPNDKGHQVWADAAYKVIQDNLKSAQANEAE